MRPRRTRQNGSGRQCSGTWTGAPAEHHELIGIRRRNFAQEHRVDVRFQFDPAADAESNLSILCFAPGEWVEEEAFVSHCYGQREASKTRRFSALLKGGGEVVSFLMPGTGWAVRELESQDGRAFEVSGEKSVDLVIIPPVGAWTWKRTVNEQVRETVSTP